MNNLQRRGLVNASVADVATFAIGSAVVYAAGGPDDVVTPPPSTSPSASPATPSCAPTWDVVRSANPGEAPTTLLGVTAVTSAEAWAVGGTGEPELPTHDDEHVLEALVALLPRANCGVLVHAA